MSDTQHQQSYTTYDVLRAKTIAFRTTATVIREALEPLDLSFNEWLALHTIAKYNSERTVHATTLSKELDVSLPYINKLCNAMVERGLIARSTDPTDLRTKALLVTGKGETLLGSSEPIVKQALAEWLAPLDRDRIHDYIATILEVAQLQVKKGSL